MCYHITFQDEEKGAALLAVLRELDFVTLTDADEELEIIPAKRPLQEGEVLPGFGAFPDWPDVKEMREADYKRRVGEW